MSCSWYIPPQKKGLESNNNERLESLQNIPKSIRRSSSSHLFVFLENLSHKFNRQQVVSSLRAQLQPQGPHIYQGWVPCTASAVAETAWGHERPSKRSLATFRNEEMFPPEDSESFNLKSRILITQSSILFINSHLNSKTEIAPVVGVPKCVDPALSHGPCNEASALQSKKHGNLAIHSMQNACVHPNSGSPQISSKKIKRWLEKLIVWLEKLIFNIESSPPKCFKHTQVFQQNSMHQ